MIEIKKFVDTMSDKDLREFASLVLLAYVQDKIKVEGSASKMFEIIAGG